MESVAEFFGKKVLRQVDEADVMSSIGAIREKTGDRAIERAIHFYNENKRVERLSAALSEGDFEAFKSTIIESGKSSYMYNQNVYTCKKPTNQPLSLALCVSEQLLSGKGAWRVHGGGFAGTVQSFVPLSEVEGFTKTIEAVFGEGSCLALSVRPDGAIKLM